jgi:hypothetical protein
MGLSPKEFLLLSSIEPTLVVFKDRIGHKFVAEAGGLKRGAFKDIRPLEA